MKKLLCLFMLFSLGCPVLAVNEAIIPRWEQFCPDYRLNAQYVSMENYEKTFIKNAAHPVAYKIFKYSIIGYPIALSAYNQSYEDQLKNNYWVQRKEAFIAEVEACNQITNNDSKIACFMDVRKFENDKNSQHERDLLAQDSLKVQQLQLYQQAQLNNNLRNINVQQSNINNNLNGIRYGY